MDLDFTNEHKLFREEVRDWLTSNVPKESRPIDGSEMRAFDVAWQKTLYDGGWAGITWPKEHGGRGCSIVERLVWFEEYARTEAPWVGCMWVGLNHGGPILMAKGSDAQKREHLPKILRGEAIWCQGFSEPNAGSDLASLRTYGEIDGDHLIVNGTKVWSSFSPVADFQELLVRTDREARKHKGISWVICDMRAPGITVQPIQTMAGHWHFAQVFYDNVRIPLENVVGGLNNGWSVAQETLSIERGIAFILEQVELTGIVESLIDMAKNVTGPDGKRPAIADDSIAGQLAMLRAEVSALRSLTYVAVSRSQSGQPPGPEGSITRLFYAELQQRIRRLAMDIIGANGLELEGNDGWPERYLNMFRHTIAAGTSEIQRNIISERILNMPRGT